jgi:uncharacterized protein (TIRG00374 family)
MDKQRRFASKSVALFFAAGLFVFLLYLYFFVPLRDFVQIIQRVNPFYFLSALGVLFVSAAFYSLAWQRLLNLLSVKASFLKAFQFICVANFIDILIPAESISGDVSRIYLMSKESGENAGRVVASVVGHRVLATSVTIGSLIISTVYFAVRYKPPPLVLEFVAILAAVSIIFIGLLFYLSMRKEATEKIVNWLAKLLVRLSRGRWQFEGLKKSAMRMLGEFHEGISTLARHPKGLILPLFFSISAWLFDVLIAVLVLLSLGSIENLISLSAIIIVYSLTVIIHFIPLVSGEVGIVEIVMTSLFTLLGNPQAIAVFAVATVLIRVLTLGVRLFLGGLTVQLMGIKNLMGMQAGH